MSDAAWLAAAFAQSLDGIVWSTPEGVIVRANAAWESSFADSLSTSARRALPELSPHELGECFARLLSRVIERGSHRDEIVRSGSDGRRASTSVTATLIREGGAPVGVLWIFRDSTSQARIAESLQALGKRFRAVVQSATDTIVVIDDAERILLWNAAAERMFGHAEKDIVGQPLSMLFAARCQSTLAPWITPRVSGRRPPDGITMEAEGVDGSGREFPVEVSFAAFASGRGRFASAIVRDISLRRSAEAELRRALVKAQESDRLKSAFLGALGHEIRTPLNVLLGTVELLVDQWRARGDASQEPAVEAMQRSAKRLIDTLERVLDYARLSTTDVVAKPERVLLGELAALEAAEAAPAAAAKGIELVTDIGDAAIAVYTDRSCLGRAVANLLDNAVKFTPRGTVRVRVTTGDDEGGAIEVEDTGVGIDATFRERLFEPFSQEDGGDDRRYEGQGLGLAVAKRSVDLCGAELEVESEKGRGSLFRIRFPIQSHAERQTEAPIVIVDLEGDEKLWRERFAGPRPLRLLMRPEDALAFVTEPSSAAALLLDLERETVALRMLRSLRQHPQAWNLHVVGWLRAARPGVAARALAAGCDEVLVPPIAWREWSDRLARRRA